MADVHVTTFAGGGFTLTLQGLYAGAQEVTTPAPTLEGVDLAATQVGLHYVFRDGSDIFCQTTYDLGQTWETPVAVGGSAASDAMPSLCVDRFRDEQLFLWYHTSTEIKCFRSPDYGVTWTLHATHSGKKWPRLAPGLDVQALAAYVGSDVVVYPTADHGVTLDAATLTVAAETQLPAIVRDFKGLLHLFYEDGGLIYHRYSEDGVNWTADPATVAGASNVSAAAGFPDIIVGRWVSSSSFLEAIISALTGWTNLAEDYADTTPQQTIGITWTPEGDLFIVGEQAGAPRLFWSPTGYAGTFQEIT
jgi:hypothetical protein